MRWPSGVFPIEKVYNAGVLRLLGLFLVLIPARGEIRVGIIGTDTSHATAFTAILNDPNHAQHIPGARVVAAYKGGSADIEESRSRVGKIAEELRAKYGVEIVPSIEVLLSKVDAVLLESVDGRTHLAQATPVIAAGKPLFIDKPLASTLDDAREIARLAKDHHVKWWSSSTLRYAEWLIAMKTKPIEGAITWGPGPLEPHHALELSWYAIHAVEMLYALMGNGCLDVTWTAAGTSDLLTGRWAGGHVGTVRTSKPSGEYGAVAFSKEGVQQSPAKTTYSYVPLVRDIVRFFETGVVPVDNQQTLEVFAFMDAAQRSKQGNGARTRLR